MLTQRAIDTSIKAYELNSVELCQQVRSTDASCATFSTPSAIAVAHSSLLEPRLTQTRL
jgi:hypothetical protein